MAEAIHIRRRWEEGADEEQEQKKIKRIRAEEKREEELALLDKEWENQIREQIGAMAEYKPEEER